METVSVENLAQAFSADVANKNIIEKLEKEIEKLRTENEHLRAVLSLKIASKPLVVVKPIEQTICETEIEKLKKVSEQRSLNLEETKRLDLLIKNLNLTKEANRGSKSSDKGLPEGITEKDLENIASIPEIINE
jgi:uncharacterized protein (UPF0210 family)